jgi:uncharacterized protein (DUF4415 family)
MNEAKRKPGRPKSEPTKPVILRLNAAMEEAFRYRGGQQRIYREIVQSKEYAAALKAAKGAKP